MCGPGPSHRAVPPKARGIVAMAAHVGDDRYAAGQTDLAPVGVPHEVQAEAGIGCHVRQFRGMDEGDLEALGRSFERRPSRVRVVVEAAVTNCATEATGYSGRAGLKMYRIF